MTATHPQASFESLNRSATLLALILIWLSLGVMLHGQDRTARLYGTVMDSSGAVIPGVQVVLTNTATGVKRESVSNDEGFYNLPKVEMGLYVVAAELGGFKKFVRRGIELLPGDAVEVNIALEVGEISESINVTEQVPLVNTASGALKTSLEAKFLEAMPLGSRDAAALLRINPGTVADWNGNYAIQGVEGRRSAYSLDGTDTKDPWDAKLNVAPPPDALQAFSVESNFSAEFGKAAGGAVLMTTRSGTNQLHGSVYDYFRSENLDANSFRRKSLGQGKGELKQHQLGFTLGGPVFLPKLYDGRNKTFFFISQQWLKAPATTYLWARGGLTQAELAGDFSQSKIIPTVSATAAAMPGSPFAGMAGQEIPNLKPYLSPTAVKWYRFYDLPIVENSGDRFYESRQATISQPQWIIRLDHAIRTSNSVSFSMFLHDNTPNQSHRDYAPATTTSATTAKNQHFSLADVWSIAPNIVNELRMGYQRVRAGQDLGEAIKDLDWNELGIPYPRFNPYLMVSWVPASFTPSYFNLQGQVSSTIRTRDTYDLNETLSLTRGRHFLKAGVTIQRQNMLNNRLGSVEYKVDGLRLKNMAAEFLIGWPSSVDISDDYHQPIRQDLFHAFFQDDWKLNSKLTLNLGLRYEPAFWGYRTDGKVLSFKPGAQSSRYPNFPSGVITVGDPGFEGKSGRPNALKNIAPRLGLAYRLDDAGKKVLRGGWGLYYDPAMIIYDAWQAGGRTAFPFIHAYTTNFNVTFPAAEAWLDGPVYSGLPKPDLSRPVDPSAAVFDPKTAYGDYFPRTQVPYTHQWNLVFEHEFRSGWLYSAGYLGHYGKNLNLYDFWNMPGPAGPQDNNSAESLAARRPIQEYRYQTRAYISNRGESKYHAAQFRLERRLPGLRLLAWYTLASSRTNIMGGLNEYLYVFHPGPLQESDYGPSSQWRRHNALVAPLWDLPFWRTRSGLARSILGGWSATGMIRVQSGAPLDIWARNNSFQCTQCQMHPNLTGQPLYIENWRKDPKLVYVNAAAFSQPADRTYGNAPLNLLRWPYTKNVDMALQKEFSLHGEYLKFQLRFDLFNLFNWVNFGASERTTVNITNTDSFSLKDYAQAPRTIQVGGRITW